MSLPQLRKVTVIPQNQLVPILKQSFTLPQKHLFTVGLLKSGSCKDFALH